MDSGKKWAERSRIIKTFLYPDLHSPRWVYPDLYYFAQAQWAMYFVLALLLKVLVPMASCINLLPDNLPDERLRVCKHVRSFLIKKN